MEEMVGMIADNPAYMENHLGPDGRDDLYEDSAQEMKFKSDLTQS